MKPTTIALALALVLLCSCASSSGSKNDGKSFTDPRDGKKYKTTPISFYIWMAENLNYNAEDSKCYEDKPRNCQKYGRLYTYEAAKTACPSGWRLPTEKEWGALSSVAGGNKVNGKNLRATKGWKVPDADSGDKLGFSALPTGAFSDVRENFFDEGYGVYWWATPETNPEESVFFYTRHINENYYRLEMMSVTGIWSERVINNYRQYMVPNMGNLYKGSTKNYANLGEHSLLSVRCIKD